MVPNGIVVQKEFHSQIAGYGKPTVRGFREPLLAVTVFLYMFESADTIHSSYRA